MPGSELSLDSLLLNVHVYKMGSSTRASSGKQLSSVLQWFSWQNLWTWDLDRALLAIPSGEKEFVPSLCRAVSHAATVPAPQPSHPIPRYPSPLTLMASNYLCSCLISSLGMCAAFLIINHLLYWILSARCWCLATGMKAAVAS